MAVTATALEIISAKSLPGRVWSLRNSTMDYAAEVIEAKCSECKCTWEGPRQGVYPAAKEHFDSEHPAHQNPREPKDFEPPEQREEDRWPAKLVLRDRGFSLIRSTSEGLDRYRHPDGRVVDLRLSGWLLYNRAGTVTGQGRRAPKLSGALGPSRG